MASSQRLKELFTESLRLLYDAHHQGASQALANSGTSSLPKLKHVFRDVAKSQLKQARRLERAFATLGLKPERKTDRGMQGLIEANNGLVARCDGRAPRDLANIAAAQAAGHFILAQAGTLRSYAAALGQRSVVRLLERTLADAKITDRMFSQLAARILRKAGDPSYPHEGALYTTAALHPARTSTALLGSLAIGAIGLALLAPPKPKPRSFAAWLGWR